MFTYVGGLVDGMLAGYVTGVLSHLLGYLLIVAVAAQSLWILIYSFKIMRGQAQEGALGFLFDALKVLIVCSLALTASLYVSNVQEIFNGTKTNLVTMFLPDVPDVPTPTSVWGALDTFDLQASELTKKALMMVPGWPPNFTALLAAILFSIGNCALLIVAFGISLWVEVLSAFVLAVGPIFILALAWKPTANYFSSWLGMLLSMIVLSLLVYFILGFSIWVSSDWVDKLLRGWSALNYAVEASAYVVLMVVFAYFLYMGPSVASSMTGGGVGQYGAGIIQQTMQTFRLMQGGNNPSRTGAGSGNNTLAAPTRLAIASEATGRVAGRSVRATGTAAERAATAAGSAVGRGGLWAYQRAAQLGRRFTKKP